MACSLIIVNELNDNCAEFWKNHSDNCNEHKSKIVKSIGTVVKYRNKFYLIGSTSKVKSSAKLTCIMPIDDEKIVLPLTVLLMSYELDITIMGIDTEHDIKYNIMKDLSITYNVKNSHASGKTNDIEPEVYQSNIDFTIKEPIIYNNLNSTYIKNIMQIEVETDSNDYELLYKNTGMCVINEKGKIIGMLHGYQRYDKITLIHSYYIKMLFDMAVKSKQYKGLAKITEDIEDDILSINNIRVIDKTMYDTKLRMHIPMDTYIMCNCLPEQDATILTKSKSYKTQCVAYHKSLPFNLFYDFDCNRTYIKIAGFTFVEFCEDLLRTRVISKNMYSSVNQLMEWIYPYNKIVMMIENDNLIKATKDVSKIMDCHKTFNVIAVSKINNTPITDLFDMQNYSTKQIKSMEFVTVKDDKLIVLKCTIADKITITL